MAFYKKKTYYGKKKYYGKKAASSKKGGTKKKTYYAKKKPVFYKKGIFSVKRADTESTNILKTRVKMKYVEHCNVSIVANQPHTTQGSHQIRANSIYDPNLAVGGDTAMGWQVMDDYYYNYMVTAAKIEVQFTMNGLEVDHPDAAGQFAFYLKLRHGDPAQAPAGSFSTLQLNGNAVWKIIPAPTPNMSVSHTLTGWYIPQRFFGPEADPRTAPWDKYGAAMNANPVTDGLNTYWDYGLWHTDDVQVGQAVYCNALVTVTYWPIFMTPKDTVQGLASDEDLMKLGESMVAKGVAQKHKKATKTKADENDAELDEITGQLNNQAIASPATTAMELVQNAGKAPKVTLAKS